MNTRTQTLPLWAPSKDWAPADLEILEVTNGAVVDGNVAYHLTHNAGKSWKIQEKVQAPGFEPWWVASHWTILPLDYKHNRTLSYDSKE
jgi:hypothetical protein